jgi:hypothetical protein
VYRAITCLLLESQELKNPNPLWPSAGKEKKLLPASASVFEGLGTFVK